MTDKIEEVKKILAQDTIRPTPYHYGTYELWLETVARQICQLFSQPEVKGWEDTVLSDGKIQTANAEAEKLSWTHKAHPAFEKEKYLLEIQAKATAEATTIKVRREATIEMNRLVNSVAKKEREAGRKEVVEWIKTNADLERGDRDVGLCFEDYLYFDYKEWQAQLKKWFGEKGLTE